MSRRMRRIKYNIIRPVRGVPNTDPFFMKDEVVLAKDFTNVELKAQCKKLGIKGYSKLNQADLVKLIFDKYQKNKLDIEV